MAIRKVLLKRHWNWGDGTEGYGIAPKHTYLTDGTYTVTMTDYFVTGPPRVVTRTSYITANSTGTMWRKPGVQTMVDAFLVVPGNEAISRHGGQHFPKAHQTLGVIPMSDAHGQPRHLIIDQNDRKIWEVFTDIGVKREVVYRDKVNIDTRTTSGHDYPSSITTRGATGSLQRFFLEPTDISVYTSAMNPVRKCRQPILADNMYNPRTRLQVQLIMDSKQGPQIMSRDLTIPRTQVGYDRRTSGHVAQNKITFSAQPLRVVGLSEQFIARNELEAPDKRSQGEMTIQMTLSNMMMWVTRGSHIRDRMTGTNISNTTAVVDITSPDTSYTTALVLTQAMVINYPTIATEIISVWHLGGVLGLGEVYTKQHGDWMYHIFSQSGLTLPVGTYYDLRVYDPDVLNDLDVLKKYYFDDIVLNKGFNVLPSWVV